MINIFVMSGNSASLLSTKGGRERGYGLYFLPVGSGVTQTSLGSVSLAREKSVPHKSSTAEARGSLGCRHVSVVLPILLYLGDWERRVRVQMKSTGVKQNKFTPLCFLSGGCLPTSYLI